MQESWVRLKMSAVSPGITYNDLNRLDVFEFFTIYTEQLKKQQPND